MRHFLTPKSISGSYEPIFTNPVSIQPNNSVLGQNIAKAALMNDFRCDIRDLREKLVWQQWLTFPSNFGEAVRKGQNKSI